MACAQVIKDTQTALHLSTCAGEEVPHVRYGMAMLRCRLSCLQSVKGIRGAMFCMVDPCPKV